MTILKNKAVKVNRTQRCTICNSPAHRDTLIHFVFKMDGIVYTSWFCIKHYRVTIDQAINNVLKTKEKGLPQK